MTSSTHQMDRRLTFKHEERLLKLQRDILELIATSNNHQLQFEKLCQTAEEMLPDSVASIMLYDSSGQHLIVHAAPSIPTAAIDQLNGLIPGPNAGSCGTAVYSEQPIYVENTFIDDRWSTVRQFAIDFNIHACWSNPILHDGKIIGSFALSSFAARTPTEFQKNLLMVCASLAAIILRKEQMELNVQRLAYFDSLTDLPNRAMFNQRLEHAVKQAQQHHHQLALMYIDVDNFKIINDSYGHITGDNALKHLASVMRECVNDSDTIARTGGDEFIILLEEINDPYQISLLAKNILEKVSDIDSVSNAQLSVSIGISLFPDDADNQHDLLRNADTAMYEAKSAGKNSFYFYKPELTTVIQHKLVLVHEIKQALKNNEFILHFQPIFDAHTKHIISAETLIRWLHPSRGMIAPSDFIPVAEENGLITKISEWVMRQACQKAKSWIDSGIKLNKISINLTADDIQTGFEEKLAHILTDTNFPPHCLELEITESILMEQGQAAIDILNRVRQSGVSIALDDFGTGYSSLSRLRKLPLDKLKIDRSFISDIPEQEEDIVMTKIIISMAKSLSLSVVAEGVETEAQSAFLTEHGCDYLQGYLLARPLSEAAFLEKLA